MARTVNEIFNNITDSFVSNGAVVSMYELDKTKSFSEQFSPVSLESIIFYRVAFAIWSLEKIFDIYKSEIESDLSAKSPHRLRWYKSKTLAFQKDYLLPEDSDVYDVTDDSAKVVKYAAAVEAVNISKVLIKIAGEENGLRGKLPDEVAMQVKNYIQTIKDAGVRIDLVNIQPDHFQCELDIYYDAMLRTDEVRADTIKAINSYIENLDFNGEYSNMALVDALQSVEGVIIPELTASKSKPSAGNYEFREISAKKIPDAGYFRIYQEEDIKINMIPYGLAHY